MNSTNLIGRLTKDPVLQKTKKNNISVCSFEIAVPKQYNKNEADYIPIVVWRTPAENAAKYLRKGSEIAVTGTIGSRVYKDDDGKSRKVIEVTAINIKYLRNNNNSDNDTSASVPEEPQMQEIEDDMPF